MSDTTQELPPQELAFLDCETTSLDPDTGVIWQLYIEKAVWIDSERKLATTDALEVLVRPDEEDMLRADPESLRINRFHDVLRAREDEFLHGWTHDVTDRIYQMLNNTWIVGAVPSFDMPRLEKLICSPGVPPNWHHRLVCVENLAAAKLGVQPPWSPRQLSKFLGVERDTENQHDARHDVMWAMRMYEAVYR